MLGLLLGRNKSFNQSYTSNNRKNYQENDFSDETKKTVTDIYDKTALSILTLIGKFEPNPVDENFDKKLAIMQYFFNVNFNTQLINREQITKAVFYSKISDTTLDQVLFKIKSIRKNDYSFYRKVIQLLLDISLVDGILSADEELTILKICIDFNIADSNPYKAYKENLSSNSSSTDNFFTQSDKDKYYGKVLGLMGQITRGDIVKRYKELVIKYHPDKVSHLGEEFQLLAEIKIKEINSAYEYFKKRYSIN